MSLRIRLEINFRVYRQDILQAPWKKQSIGFHFLKVLFHQWQCLTCNYGSSNTWWMNRQLYSRDYSWHGVLFFYSLYIFLYIPLSSPILRQVACHFPFHMSQFNEMSLWKISLNTDSNVLSFAMWILWKIKESERPWTPSDDHEE